MVYTQAFPPYFFSSKKNCRRFIRWFAGDPRYNLARIRLAKKKAKILDGHIMDVVRCTPTIYGCIMRLYCFSNVEEDYSVTVFGEGAKNGYSRVKVVFKEEADARLWSVYKSGYTRKVGAYLKIVAVYR